MKISSRFSIAVHILSLLAISPSAHGTSEWIAGSVGTNPVIIRRVLGQLKKAGLVTVRAGIGGVLGYLILCRCYFFDLVVTILVTSYLIKPHYLGGVNE
jgi:hypothetical protein